MSYGFCFIKRENRGTIVVFSLEKFSNLVLKYTKKLKKHSNESLILKLVTGTMHAANAHK